MNFYLNQVLKAFSEMDAQQLEELLDPQYTYQEVPLEVFVRKLENIFTDFRIKGDEYLEVLSGNCCSLSCNADKSRSAYRFVGNQTRNYLSFRFLLALTDDRNDYEITDIFHCHDIICHEPKDWFGEAFHMRIHLDEKQDYLSSPDQTVYTEIALRAMSELNSNKGPFTFEELEAWLLKFRSTFDFIEEGTVEVLPFESLKWRSFSYSYGSLLCNFQCISRIKEKGYLEAEYRIQEFSEKVLLEDFQEIEKIIFDEQCDHFFYDLTAERDYKLHFQEKLLHGDIFNQFSRFWAWFIPLQEKLVKKYYALNEAETDEFIEAGDYLDPNLTLNLLSFHMDIRKKAKQRKEYIPIRTIDSDEEKT
jgi:hypothetical protein